MNIIVFDRREIFREGLAKLLLLQPDVDKVCTCGTLSECVIETGDSSPDITILDTEVQDGSSKVIEHLLTAFPESKVLILTHSEDSNDLFTTIKKGAQGYLTKDVTFAELMHAIRTVLNGHIIISPIMASKMVQEFRLPEGPMKEEEESESGILLTKREHEVLDLLSDGVTNKDIANALFITENTVKVHLRNIMEKLHVKTRFQAARYQQAR